MEKRRTSTPIKKKMENMDKAAKKGWRSVFAGGRWEDGEENDVYEREETIPFVSQYDLTEDRFTVNIFSSCEEDDTAISRLIVS